MNKNLARRYNAEHALVLFGRLAIVVSLAFLTGLLINVAITGWRALLKAEIAVDVMFDSKYIEADGQADVLAYQRMLASNLKTAFPDHAKRKEHKQIKKLFSFGAAIKLKGMVTDEKATVGETMRVWLPTSSKAELHIKAFEYLPGSAGKKVGLSDLQVKVLDSLNEQNNARLSMNTLFFIAGDSRDPELAGIGGALMGSLLALIVTLVVSFPVSVAAAIYLELLAPRNRFFDIVEVNINNLAAVPSVIIGLLGLSILIGVFGIQRSTPLIGGMVLALLTLPTIIISARAALKAVPASLLEGALSLGATRLQGIFHQVLPSAMPGILTGTIIGMAGALGETAPLLMVGMVAFVVAVPTGFLDVATALPVQIFLWSDSPERGFVEKSALAVCVLIVFLLLINAFAIYLRRHFEKYR